MIPGFEDGLDGAKAGEERVLNLTSRLTTRTWTWLAKPPGHVTVNSVSEPWLLRAERRVLRSIRYQETGIEGFRTGSHRKHGRELRQAIVKVRIR